jgi:hypothetical protein
MMIEKLSRIEGSNLVFRFIRPDDADYVYGLRTNPTYNTHLSKVEGTVDEQRRWIEAYKAREAEFREFYYVIERMDGIRCGLVRLYNITKESFTWGSWILDHNKPSKAALESAFLIYKIAFKYLNINHAKFDVRRDNAHTLSFHRKFGAIEVSESEEDIYFIYSSEMFDQDMKRFTSLLKIENNK